jgi:hypothetical protein
MNSGMVNEFLSDWLHWWGGEPCFRIYGKGRRERYWRPVSVFATHRRDALSPWPLWQDTCITWTADVIVIGWDLAATVLGEQRETPASRQFPVIVPGGRLRDLDRPASASEILAHECGHTWQALRLGAAYLPLVGSTTLFQEGPNSWNRFENEASAEGVFGGLINGSVSTELLKRMPRP